ncbi:rhodanese-like domain-containing protein [Bacillus aquiflavi]|uniref:Rhodanese-like domain-containing protein n=1 Tax=Bacillus aquiflavi TaxID=2672567 RepID=A0A6B3VSL9_9BACI|nr:rhodanese-like domain-containing protein [Bacillus aquiflavi]MBA4536903.1 rhodanese-like domain-containing protein [Bacillus aquiflavi]NEY81270.1 rhodanese-like domain-containing protein [Bacillus aquiflavi]UAC47619.1 rhodanese-like domain-containing protein [Bacillus aquiflavi]
MEEIQIITPEQVKAKVEAGEKLNIIDVREEEEVALGTIPGAIHIPMGEIPFSLASFDKNKEYIFICRSGNRSGHVCYYLQEQGFNVWNMIGGMLEWTGKTI